MTKPHPLQQQTFSGSKKSPHLLITGGVHGDEFEPMLAIRQLIHIFESSVDLQNDLQGTITLIPVVNEAAFFRGQRTAEDNLDLARVCPGDVNGTITMQVAHAVSQQIREADYFIDLHTGGTMFAVAPMTGYVLHSNSKVLDAQRRMAHAFNLPIIWGTAPTLQGRTLSVARDANVPAIYAEYLGSATSNAQGVQSYVEGCLNVMAELNMLNRLAPASKIKHLIEDSRPDSGHMQVCNPSPITGCFTPDVKVGDMISQGERLGIVTDILGENKYEILAEQTGIVLTLRTFPRVHDGDSLGVIVEVETTCG